MAENGATILEIMLAGSWKLVLTSRNRFGLRYFYEYLCFISVLDFHHFPCCLEAYIGFAEPVW
jgi:hypothetical protein